MEAFNSSIGSLLSFFFLLLLTPAPRFFRAAILGLSATAFRLLLLLAVVFSLIKFSFSPATATFLAREELLLLLLLPLDFDRVELLLFPLLLPRLASPLPWLLLSSNERLSAKEYSSSSAIMVDSRDGVLAVVGCLRLRGGRGVIPSGRDVAVDEDGVALRRRGADGAAVVAADRPMV